MSRRAAKEQLSLEEYREPMRGVYTTSVKESTLDEAPMAYKSLEESFLTCIKQKPSPHCTVGSSPPAFPLYLPRSACPFIPADTVPRFACFPDIHGCHSSCHSSYHI